MTPDAILAYYDERNFKDWEHADTLAPMLKVQHPEFETIYGGKQTTMAKNGYSCGDCHMGTVERARTASTRLTTGPARSRTTAAHENDCNSCHKDLKKQVADWRLLKKLA